MKLASNSVFHSQQGENTVENFDTPEANNTPQGPIDRFGYVWTYDLILQTDAQAKLLIKREFAFSFLDDLKCTEYIQDRCLFHSRAFFQNHLKIYTHCSFRWAAQNLVLR